jgi:UDP-3-O-[3-hydroxymyristoyl] glucosamine N-acyltransferase
LAVLLRDVAAIVGGIQYGKGSFSIRDILPPEDATSRDLTFLFSKPQHTDAGAVIADRRVNNKHGIIVSDARQALYILLKHLDRQRSSWYVSPHADIASDVQIPSQCSIAAFAVIEKGARIQDRVIIGSHCHVGRGVTVGCDVVLCPHVVLLDKTVVHDHVAINSNTVIGTQGFGFVKDNGFQRMPHIGGVVIESFVEIGASVTIDRATIGDTVIGRGTKVDNQVHIGHNVKIGKNCILMGQVGIAGSARIGDNVTLCGQVGISDHVTIGDNVTVYAKSAVFKPIPAGSRISGIPAREHRAVLRALGRLYRQA